jgi:hypothetical protein
VTPLDEFGRAVWESSRDVVGRDISTGGLGFVAAGLAPAQRVLLTIPGSEPPVQVQAAVRHWQPVAGNMVEVGCRFEAPQGPVVDSPLADPVGGALLGLVARLAEQQRPFEERRAWQRIPYTERIEIEVAGGAVIPGFGRDLSRGGIGFLAARDLAREFIRVRLPGGEQGPLVVRARVVRSTRLIDEFHDVAAQFVP